MNDRDRFLATYYNPDTLTRESSGVFGLIDNRFHTTPFLPVTLESGLVNPVFLDFAYDMQSFYCECDRGSASFRCENRATKKGNKQYWYAYKKVDGKTKRFNIGDLSKINFETIEQAVDVVCGLEVAHKKSATKKAIAPVAPVNAIANCTTELAGNGKSDKHLQPSVIDCFESLAIAQDEIIILNKMLKEAQDDVRIANEKEHSLWVENGQLKGKLKKQADNAPELAECKQLLSIRNGELNQAIADLESSYGMNDHLQRNIDSLQDELRKTETQAYELNERGLGLKELHHEALQRIHQLEFFLNEKNEFIHNLSQNQDANIEYCKNLIPTIENYRAMTAGKTKKANPRYAYLMDFLAEIDKLC